MEPSSGAKPEYRFIIVGAGSAGCLLARLLAERQDQPIALIEAGAADAGILSNTPCYYPRLFKSRHDWAFQTTPQSGLAKRVIQWPRGKVVGGSAAINAMIYLQPSLEDVSRWIFESRCGGSGWLDMVPPRKSGSPKGETDESLSCPYSGLPLAPVAQPHRWTSKFLQVCGELGLDRQQTWYRSSPDSCGQFQLCQQNGRRVHSGSLLREAMAAGALRSAVDVYNTSLVKRILMRRERAVGVELHGPDGSSQSNSTTLLHCTGEVILCAGAVGTPLLLMQSGIGPARSLQASGVACALDSPLVGQNLRDHLVFPIVYQMDHAAGLPSRFPSSARRSYRRHASGPLASNIAESGCIFRIPTPESQQRNIQIHATPTHYLKYPFTNTSSDHFSLVVGDLNPQSRGSIRLHPDGSGKSQLLIDPAYLDEPSDRAALFEAVQYLIDQINTTSFREQIVGNVLPRHHATNPAALGKSIAKLATTIFHPVGTCQMGHSAANSVVDERLQLRGIKGLRIADASVLPDLPSGNPNATILWLAANAANFLLA